DEELILDEPARAEGKEFYRLGGLSVSEDGKMLAWSEDTDGSERFTIRVKNLDNGEPLAIEIPETIGSPVWASDGRSILYMRVSKEWRPYQVRRHVLGTDPSNDTVLYEETDTSFFVGLGKTQSRKYVVISSGDHVTSECYVIPADDVTAKPRLISKRQANHQYDVDHANGTFFIRTNDTHENFRVVTADESNPVQENWKSLIEGSDSVYIRGVSSFKNFLVLSERLDGLDQIRIRSYAGDEHRVEFPESAYAAGIGSNSEFDISMLRLRYESMVTPDTVYDYSVADRTLKVRKVQEIPSGYDASDYATERLMAKARDGVLVPVSIVYKKSFKKGAGAPLHLYGYGAYGMGMTPSFSTSRLSLLDRGFAYAIAHIRGGDE
ncbi:MAG: S9 family peptidase, partial [Myxococcota bacterium]